MFSRSRWDSSKFIKVGVCRKSYNTGTVGVCGKSSNFITLRVQQVVTVITLLQVGMWEQ